METLVRKVMMRAIKAHGHLALKDLVALRAYSAKHGMWRALATPDTIKAFDSIMARAAELGV